MSRLRMVPVLLALVLFSAACADAVQGAVVDRSTSSSSTTSGDAGVFVGPGWIGGEPQWRFDGGDETADLAEDRLAADSASPHAAGIAETDGTELSLSSPVEGPPAGLSGGSIDDNKRFADYLSYRERIKQLGIPARDLDVSGRIVVTVSGANGLPVAGAQVRFTEGETSMTLRTTADGTVRFHPTAYGMTTTSILVQAGDVIVDVAPGDELEIESSLAGGAASPMPMDIVFLLDATGSMGDEIAQLKATISQVASRIGDLPVAPDVRFAMTLYRDLDDSFVTSTFDLTSDIATFDEALSAVVADGGGDYAEALDEGLAAALNEPSWRDPSEAIQLVFLVGDAPPQIGRAVQQPYTDSMRNAAVRGIKIFPISSSGTDDQAEFVFRQMAQFTGGRYVFLSYGAGGRATGETSDISEVDYEELALDDLIVRLVAEELADLSGDATVVPPPQTTTTQANPNG